MENWGDGWLCSGEKRRIDLLATVMLRWAYCSGWEEDLPGPSSLVAALVGLP